jgi:hypothetical protein
MPNTAGDPGAGSKLLEAPLNKSPRVFGGPNVVDPMKPGPKVIAVLVDYGEYRFGVAHL